MTKQRYAFFIIFLLLFVKHQLYLYMLAIVIYFNLFLAVYYFIIKNYDKRACKHMDATSDVIEATKLRKRLILKRKKILIWWFIIAFLSIFLMNIIQLLMVIKLWLIV